MSISDYEAGSIALGSGATSATDTLATTVTQGNSILNCSVSGGSNSAQEQNIRVALSGGTTVTATRTNSGSAATIQHQVIESASFTVQHFDVAVTGAGVTNVAISAVDTAYSFIIPCGVSRAGGTRGNDDFAAIEITTSTNVAIEFNSAGTARTVAFQVVEMSSSEIASVNLYKITQDALAKDTTITSVNTAKTLMFCSARFNAGAGGTVLQNDYFPHAELTSSTNLRLNSRATSTDLKTWVYVVEFVNLSVTHNKASTAGATTTEVLGGAPTYGGAVINGIYGRYSTANDTDDDSLEGMWSAALSGSTWTFTRGASTVTGDISYTVFDWNDIFAAPTGLPSQIMLMGVG